MRDTGAVGARVLRDPGQHVVDTVRLCAELGVPFVARGSGTGLSGGALPVADGVLLVLSVVSASLLTWVQKQRLRPGQGGDGAGGAPPGEARAQLVVP